jgi:hypothetical protein
MVFVFTWLYFVVGVIITVMVNQVDVVPGFGVIFDKQDALVCEKYQ